MQVILHIGAHCTDEDRLLNTLLRNAPMLAEHGTSVPKPASYRKLLREVLMSLTVAPPTAEARDMFLARVLEDGPADRMILSVENLMGLPHRIFENETLYRLAPRRLQALSQLMAQDDVEIFLGIRNPATFLPAAFSKVEGRSFRDFMAGADPLAMRWSDLIWRIRDAVPEMPITVWCNEDTPFIWGQILREMAALEPNDRLRGGFDLLAEIMSPEGLSRFRYYLKAHPPQSIAHQRRIIAAFLDKYALDEAVEEEVDLPDIPEADLLALSETYDEDVYEIERIPGVHFIAP